MCSMVHLFRELKLTDSCNGWLSRSRVSNKIYECTKYKAFKFYGHFWVFTGWINHFNIFVAPGAKHYQLLNPKHLGHGGPWSLFTPDINMDFSDSNTSGQLKHIDIYTCLSCGSSWLPVFIFHCCLCYLCSRVRGPIGCCVRSKRWTVPEHFVQLIVKLAGYRTFVCCHQINHHVLRWWQIFLLRACWGSIRTR